MRRLLGSLAATGYGLRALLGVCASLAVASVTWPVAAGLAPPRPMSLAPVPQAHLGRPLFDPGRRDWTARGSRDAVLAGDSPRPVLTLRGISLDGSSARILIDDGSGDQTWLARGQGRADWQVIAIDANRATLTQDGRLYTLEFLGTPVTLRPVRAPSEAGLSALRP